MYHSNAWGYVCDQHWDKKDADVFCRMLGYTGSSSDSKSTADYGRGNNVYWLKNVQCVGNEQSIFSCAHDGLKKQDCANGKEAKAACVGLEGQKVTLFIIYYVSFSF